MSTRFWIFLTALALASPLLPSPAVSAERTDCASPLQKAEQSFDEGRFDEAREHLGQCLDHQPPEDAMIRGLALLAKIQLAEDDVTGAGGTMLKILRLESDYEAGSFEPPRFRDLIDKARGARNEVKVNSVSKSSESLREAPATVEVLTGEQIRHRGYLDLEAVLHDLPGFNISRGNGTVYSNIYQRGFRSTSTERTLFLVDGVEHNDLFSNVAWISRQYPLSNIDRIEVIYGPASTIYGSNAYTGVIHIVTKTAEMILKENRARESKIGSKKSASSKFENIAVQADLGGGSFSTQWVDTTVAGKTRNGGLSFVLTGRLFQSDERDLSGFSDWDYKETDFIADDSVYQGIEANSSEFGEQCLSTGWCEFNDSGMLVLTDSGVIRAKELDGAAASSLAGGEPVGFSDLTDDWYISGKINIQDIEIGMQTWHRREGSTPWYRETARPGADNGFTFIPEQTALYLRYSREVARDLTFSIFSRYKRHKTDPDTSTFSLQSYGSGRLGLEDLFNGQTSYFRQTRLLRSSNQLRNEVTLFYNPSTKFQLLTGAELRDGSIQRTSVSVSSGGPGIPDVPDLINGESADVQDIGFFAQASYRPRENLKLVLGGRWDSNRIDLGGGSGDVFNPRLAVVYSPGNFTYKAIYADAFKDASNFNRFATIAGTRELDNPALEPENASNIELSASWQIPGRQIEVIAYEATYDDVVNVQKVPFCKNEDVLTRCEDGDTGFQGTTDQFNNTGSFRVRGVQASGRFKVGRFDLFGNYTFTEPINTDLQVRVGDIAEHQLNLGFYIQLWSRLDLSTRLNYVSDRRTGPGTTVDSQKITQVDQYTVVHASATWKNLVRGVDLQIVINNLLDEEYTDPGVRAAGNMNFVAELPQPGRSAYLRARLYF